MLDQGAYYVATSIHPEEMQDPNKAFARSTQLTNGLLPACRSGFTEAQGSTDVAYVRLGSTRQRGSRTSATRDAMMGKRVYGCYGCGGRFVPLENVGFSRVSPREGKGEERSQRARITARHKLTGGPCQTRQGGRWVRLVPPMGTNRREPRWFD
ncbi:hypothetical protein PYCCODRAFT_175985 [Trametes coccinea BRFM310]|uniref:Uncharacterized protein n=1 Tax=Trametes coccinea (strain BRFM310) TaxID=1353009 RepID=A0A1Y2ISI2_TRAC3|nr:hypothetical protein PYCCODRAFT_175985 [Trametes coccinea BRFM310]